MLELLVFTYNTEQECIDDPSNPCGSVAINENDVNSISLFPNPAQNVLNIDGNFESIEIYDVFVACICFR